MNNNNCLVESENAGRAEDLVRDKNLPSEKVEELRRNPPNNCNVREGAFYLGLGVRTVWELIAAKKLKACRIGRRVILRTKDLDEFLQRKAV